MPNFREWNAARLAAANADTTTPKAYEPPTPIQKLAELIPRDAAGETRIGEMLVPEQCMQVWLGDAWYHVTIQPMP